MRSVLLVSLVSLTALAACGGSGGIGANAGSGDNHPAVCQEQHELAKLGKRPNGEISISCPDHGIGFAYE